MYRIWLSVLGTGFSPVVPGTCGSAVVAIIFLITTLLSNNPYIAFVIMLAVAVHGFVVTVVYGDRFIEKYGPDPKPIVSDEQCGQAITYLWLWPLLEWNNSELVVFILIGFVLFRVFDIVKPPPARQLEHVKGAWGVLLDDVAAGVYALLGLQIIWRLGWLNLLSELIS